VVDVVLVDTVVEVVVISVDGVVVDEVVGTVVGVAEVVVTDDVVVVGAAVVVVGGLPVVVVVVVLGGAQVPSAEQASNLLKFPSMAPHALPFLHLSGELTIDAFTLFFFFGTQQTAAFSLPQREAFSHFLISLRHCFCGMSAVRFASLSVLCTHFL